jgi:hypothetical protein
MRQNSRQKSAENHARWQNPKPPAKISEKNVGVLDKIRDRLPLVKALFACGFYGSLYLVSGAISLLFDIHC